VAGCPTPWPLGVLQEQATMPSTRTRGEQSTSPIQQACCTGRSQELPSRQISYTLPKAVPKASLHANLTAQPFLLNIQILFQEPNRTDRDVGERRGALTLFFQEDITNTLFFFPIFLFFSKVSTE